MSHFVFIASTSGECDPPHAEVSFKLECGTTRRQPNGVVGIKLVRQLLHFGVVYDAVVSRQCAPGKLVSKVIVINFDLMRCLMVVRAAGREVNNLFVFIQITAMTTTMLQLCNWKHIVLAINFISTSAQPTTGRSSGSVRASRCKKSF